MGSMAEEQNRSWNDRYMLRLPDGMRDRIKAAAEANNRSMNAEIVATLEEKYPVRGLFQRLQAVMHMADDVLMDDGMSPTESDEELKILKDIALKIIGKMSESELRRARTQIWYPGELDVFDDWPPQGWRDDGK